ncbi:hypothetical protein PAPYR_7299 [Paratrimastix pyriformis]|uniref:Uncharacterized protein n=1 Tax=Paratrimastix pyriformis TaxID=342808 RepID=A0ABQ8UKJ8_9EUKA|nr:hypothetical protein PAPYR_7299 [Paratrimastix pyriformis]
MSEDSPSWHPDPADPVWLELKRRTRLMLSDFEHPLVSLDQIPTYDSIFVEMNKDSVPQQQVPQDQPVNSHPPPPKKPRIVSEFDFGLSDDDLAPAPPVAAPARHPARRVPLGGAAKPAQLSDILKTLWSPRLPRPVPRPCTPPLPHTPPMPLTFVILTAPVEWDGGEQGEAEAEPAGDFMELLQEQRPAMEDLPSASQALASQARYTDLQEALQQQQQQQQQQQAAHSSTRAPVSSPARPRVGPAAEAEATAIRGRPKAARGKAKAAGKAGAKPPRAPGRAEATEAAKATDRQTAKGQPRGARGDDGGGDSSDAGSAVEEGIPSPTGAVTFVLLARVEDRARQAQEAADAAMAQRLQAELDAADGGRPPPPDEHPGDAALARRLQRLEEGGHREHEEEEEEQEEQEEEATKGGRGRAAAKRGATGARRTAAREEPEQVTATPHEGATSQGFLKMQFLIDSPPLLVADA